MTGTKPWTGTIAAVLLSSLAIPALAQELTSSNQVTAKTDWSVFVETTPSQQCWSVSTPTESVNTRDGRVVAVQRGQTLLMVYYQPDVDHKGVVAFTGGYPLGGPSVTVEISGNSFELFTDEEWAYPDPSDNDKVINAMKRGAQAVVSGVSTRGTATKDTFSLLGFTAAMDDAGARCTN
jgi:invasion protein IalB